MAINCSDLQSHPREPWVEHFDWLEPLFNERLQIENGRMTVPTRPGIGVSLSDQARAWTRERAEIGQRFGTGTA